ncbi:retention module-containing protein [Pseudomonas sp. BBP2017]|uniref:retention module-containing protein n=1 Tax=Pseudomonas sp. BBP2017 TaxID=2109731 RepID=UPI000D123514|nr:retention module-containing protein [Pseudomonas sp. BBP2017]PSS50728.1 RTX toxin [Pseudomonas sp. BBP2017]
MAKLIGIVSKVVGEVFAVASDGTRRALAEGDRLFAGEQLQTGAAGAVAVHLQNGAELTLGRDSSLELSPQLLANQAPHVDAPQALTPSQAQLTDVEKLQQAIASGADPSQDADPTAAGPGSGGAPGAIGGGHSFVMLSEVGGRVDPVIGFPTAGFNGFVEVPELDVGDLNNNNDALLAPLPVVNNPVIIDGLQVEGGELSLNEANLAQGSASDPAALIQTGSFTVVAADGVFNLNVGGINVVTAGAVTGVGQSITTGLGNVLTITGYDAATGVVSYSYTLSITEAHPNGGGANGQGESISVLVSDTDGDVASGSLDVTVIDDMPRAVADSNALTATENQLTLTGNVLTNDVQGADRIASGPITPQTITGTYGTLVLAADGSYTYTLNTSDADFINLKGGGSGVESFTYTLKDADGDSSTATLKIDVSNLNDPVTLNGLNVEGGELAFYEQSLNDGSSPNGSALTQGGSFTVSAPDGLQTLTVGGITVVSGGNAVGFPQSATTPEGNTLTITGYNASTGVVTYIYTLLDNEAHSSGNGTTLSESFSVVAIDTDGSSASGHIDVNIVDDAPKANDDTNTTAATEAQLTLTGNVLTNDVQGADRIASGPITPQTITGTYGTLVLAADGSYTYTLNTSDPDFINLKGGGSGVESFTYTLKDADGDSSTATLKIDVSNLNDPVTLNGLNVEGGELAFYEQSLNDGSSPNGSALTQGGSFTVSAPDGLQTLTVGGITVVSGGNAVGFPQSVSTPEGNTLTITGYNASTGVVTYTYTLLGNEAHSSGNGTTLSESFSVVAIDTDGSSASGHIDVNIVDDAPKANDDTHTTTATEPQLTLTGNVLTNDVQGADRIASGPITPQTITGTYGTLVLAADGSYTYTLNTSDPDFINLKGGGSGVESFTYTLKDADGDSSTATLKIDVSNLNDPVEIHGLDLCGGELTFYEQNLSDGSSPDQWALTKGGTFTVVAPDGLQSLVIGGITLVSGGVVSALPLTGTTPLGNSMTIHSYDPSTGVVVGTFTLLDNESHTSGNTLVEQIEVVATDSDGSTGSATIDINIVDDAPKANDDTHTTTATEAQLTLTGNVLSNDVQGADRIASGPIIPQTITGTYGTLVLAADGSYTYTLHTNDPDFINLKGGGSGVESFTYTLKDADGDSSTATLKIDVSNLNDPVEIHGLDLCGGELTFYEQNLSDGSSPDQWALTKGGTFTVVAPDGLQSLVIGGITLVSGGVVSALPLTGTTPLGNSMTIHSYDPSTGVVVGTFTLLDNESHTSGNTLVEQIEVVATDSDGSTGSATIDINIVDDAPKANDDTHTTTATEAQLTLTGNVLSNDVQGADRIASGPIIPQTITGTYGTLVLAADGSYTYTLHTNDADFINLKGGSGVESFTYTLKDADGDSSTATLKIDVSNLNDPVEIHGLDLCGGELTFYEQNLSDGSSPDQWALTKGGTFTVVAPDGLQSLVIGGITLVSGGVVSALPLTGTTPLGNSMTIHSYDPSTGLVVGTFTLLDNENHATGQGTNTLVEQVEVVATDKDGSTAHATLDVNIVDDVPAVVGAERSVTPGQIDSNLLLIIDVSGSMNDQSGVQGKTRIELAKDAINALLDKYDEMGDVKVQIVTFNSSASEQSGVWVSVAQAKQIVAGLSAGGGTNYDDAVAEAKSAFANGGSLTGAQNIGYFFSDGNPSSTSQGIDASDEIAWKSFLDNNGIKSYAIGLGNGVNASNLDPLAYDGRTHTDTNAVVVTDLNALNQVLSGTVQGAPITGSLMNGGIFGADGGFIKALLVDGTTYTYDPKGQGSYSASGVDRGSFDTATNTFNIKTIKGGTLLVDMDTGEFTYTPPKDSGTTLAENISFTASDNDGDLSSANLVVNVYSNAAPVAGADHIITNILSSTITVPVEALLANDSDANNDLLSASPISFTTNWAAKGAGFTVGNGTPTVGFSGTTSNLANQSKDLPRSSFRTASNTTTAALLVSGYLGALSSGANAEDVLTVTLKKGETLKLDHDRPAGNILMEWKGENGVYQTIADGSSFTASHDGVYSIHMVNLLNPAGGNADGWERYALTMKVDYANAQNQTYNGAYTVSDGHGGTGTGNVDITYQQGSVLTGTDGHDTLLGGTGSDTLNAGAGNDVLTGGNGNDILNAGDGNDLLNGGSGNDQLNGGGGIDTASYTGASGGVSVSLASAAEQNTGGAGRDILSGIENLIGSDYNDNLTGDGNANLLSGGLGNDALNADDGNDVLIGGPGNDTLTGGDGNDIFLWQQGNTGRDVVTDFTPGTDRLDLSQLLHGENATSASLDDYLHFKVTGSGAGVVSTIEVSAVAGAAPTQIIDLAGVNLAQHYGVTAGAGGVIAAGQDTATIINGMLNDHSLKVDTV